MLLLVAYALMLNDLIMTLVNSPNAGELNPVWMRVLETNATEFIYAKILVSIALALGLLVLQRVRPRVGLISTILTIVVYAGVAYIHVEVNRANNLQPPLLPAVVDRLDQWLSPHLPAETETDTHQGP